MSRLRERDFGDCQSWRGKWIWATPQGKEPNAYAYARKEFRLAAMPTQAILRITADTRYRLYVNGRPAGRGPVMSQPYFTYYDSLDIAEHLREGDNCLAIEAYHIGHFPDTRGGLLAELDVDGTPCLQTDDSWRVRRADAWWPDTFYFHFNQAAPYQEVYDSQREPQGWQKPGFDDFGWSGPHVAWGRDGDTPPAVPPWSKLLPRDIPAMVETAMYAAAVVAVEECIAENHRCRPLDLSLGLSTAGRPVQHSLIDGVEALCAEAGTTTLQCSTKHLDRVFDGIHDPCVTLDLGQQVTAYLELDIEGPAGGMIDVGYAERLTDGHFVNSIEGQLATRLVFRGGRQAFRSYNWVGFRYLKLRLRQCGEPVRIHALRAVNTGYPYEEKGRFSSPDALLNRIWEISRATVRLCSNEGITDTPWREQGQWLGDVAAVTLGSIYAAFGDTELPAKFLRQSAANQLPTGFITNMTNTVSFDWLGAHTDYSLWWIQALWEHILYTGEERWLHQLYPTVVKLIMAHCDYLNEDGLVEHMPYRVFVDWADVDRRGASAPYNAIFYGALQAAQAMAERKGDRYMVQLTTELRQDIQANFRATFFAPERGCFADSSLNGRRSAKTSEHANLAPIVFGLCDRETAAAIIDRLFVARAVGTTRAEPFFTWQVLKGLDRAGRFDLALDLVRERWGWMVARGQTTVSEEWGRNGTWRGGETYHTLKRTESHAWSACPVEFLTKTLIGLEILEPGCRRVRLNPRPVDLAAYEVVYPTPLGPIQVSKGPEGVSWQTPPGMVVAQSLPE